VTGGVRVAVRLDSPGLARGWTDLWTTDLKSAYICMHCCYLETMALVQVRDVPDETVARLKAQAKAKGITMAAYIREELEKLANRRTNKEVLEEIQRDLREQPPLDVTMDEIVAIIRRHRDG